MIYSKACTFPYPVLQNDLDDYINSDFSLIDVDIIDSDNEYKIRLTNSLSSNFLKELLISNKAKIIAVFKSKDNQFFSLDSINEHIIKIKKRKLNLADKTKVQLLIIANEDICLSNNNELNDFYSNFKEKLNIKRGSAIAISSIVTCDGSLKKPFDLFSKRFDPELNTDLNIKLEDEVICIVYKNEDIVFNSISNSRNFTNPYLYIGLQKALFNIIATYSKNRDLEEGIDLDELDIHELKNSLDEKIVTILRDKKIKDLNFDNIDEVIQKISDNIIKKYVNSVKGLATNEY